MTKVKIRELSLAIQAPAKGSTTLASRVRRNVKLRMVLVRIRSSNDKVIKTWAVFDDTGNITLSEDCLLTDLGIEVLFDLQTVVQGIANQRGCETSLWVESTVFWAMSK